MIIKNLAKRRMLSDCPIRHCGIDVPLVEGPFVPNGIKLLRLAPRPLNTIDETEHLVFTLRGLWT